MVKDANPNKLAFLKSLGISVELRMKNIPGIQKRIKALSKVVRAITNDEKVCFKLISQCSFNTPITLDEIFPYKL